MSRIIKIQSWPRKYAPDRRWIIPPVTDGQACPQPRPGHVTHLAKISADRRKQIGGGKNALRNIAVGQKRIFASRTQATTQ